MQPVTPSKSSDGIEHVKQALSAKWGFYFPPRHNSPSRRNPNDIEEKIHNLIQFLFWRKGFDAGALEYALGQFERQAPDVVSNWAFKPKADSDVLPTRPLQESSLKADFLNKRPSLDDIQMKELMVCLYENLNKIAEKIKSGQSFIQPPIMEIVSSIEAVEDASHEPTAKQKRSTAALKKPWLQMKLDQWFRSKSAPNPSVSDDFLDDETEDVFSDIEMCDASSIPPSKAVLDSPCASENAQSSPDTERFETPPTSPLLHDVRDSNDLMFKKPAVSPSSRKRPCPDNSRLLGSRKSSRDSTNFSPVSKHSGQADAFSDLSLKSPSTSFGTEESSSTLFNTTSSSGFTSPNTSFSTTLSADSKSRSFTYSSEEPDHTTHAALPGKSYNSITNEERLLGAENTEAKTIISDYKLDIAAQENVAHDRLYINTPFGQALPERSAHLPLRQIYEVMRVSLDSGIEFSKFSSVLTKDCPNYDRLWSSMTSIVKTHQSSMPERCSHGAWEKADLRFDEVEMSGRLIIDDGSTALKPLLRITLNPLIIERSYRQARHFGGDRFLIVNFPGLEAKALPQSLKAKGDELREVLTKWLVETNHHFLGRTWRAFFLKQDRPVKSRRLSSRTMNKDRFKIFMFAEDGPGYKTAPTVGEADPRQPNHQSMSVQDMLEWFVPAESNRKEPALKLFARLQLAVSKTVPTIIFRPNEIIRSDDAYAESPSARKLSLSRSDVKKRGIEVERPKSAVMNDGCSRISRAAARDISLQLRLDHVPCAFQGRIGGAKGMWMVDVSDEQLDPQGRGYWIEITDQQLKFECHSLDLFSPSSGRVTFEVNEYVKPLAPSSLNFQLMPILENRGVPTEHLISLLKEDLTDKVNDLQAAMESALTLRLWNQRNNPTTIERAKSGGIEMLGGIPKSSTERINWFIEHGFEPKECLYLKDQLFSAIHSYCERLEARMDIGIGQSTYAYILADPLAILDEGEIQLCFSSSFHDPKSGFDEAMLHDRDVLVARSPAHLASDVQKVRAIFKPELRFYQDVIIFSSKGADSLAGKLSGGDYDGDKAWICWDPRIVDPFVNTDPPDPAEIGTYGISKDTTSTADLIENERLSTKFIHHGFTFNLRNSMLGKCSLYHEKYCYSGRDIQNSKAIEIAKLLGLLVDSTKNGFIFEESQWIDYMEKKELPRNLPKPAYKDQHNSQPSNHLIDRLVFETAKDVSKNALKCLAEKLKDVGSWDKDLSAFRKQEMIAAQKDAELTIVLKNVDSELESIYTFWKQNARSNQEEPERNRHSRRKGNEMSFNALVEKCRADFVAISPTLPGDGKQIASDRIREWRLFHAGGQSSYWDLLKASIAFYKYHKTTFLWYMAGIELGEIKAAVKGRGTYRMTVNHVYNAMKMNGRFIEGTLRREDLEDDDIIGSHDEFGVWDWADEV